VLIRLRVDVAYCHQWYAQIADASEQPVQRRLIGDRAA
jgi:hypothetical protein